jgi:hypothetical protein
VRLFSYIVASDSGLAPNPFWGSCTLAVCKPVIRRTAEIGDWVVGLSPKASGNRLVYAMQVSEKLPFDAYFADARFERKKPDYTAPGAVWRRGDNFYMPGPEPGAFTQLRSNHSKPDGEDPKSKAWDLSGLYVLVSDNYWYFGESGQPLPESLHALKVGRGHRCHFPQEVIDEFIAHIRRLPQGVNGPPTRWRPGDDTWRSPTG